MAAEWTHRSLSPPPLLFTVLTGVYLRHCSFVFLFVVLKKKKNQLLLRTIRQAYFQDSSVAPLSYQLNSSGGLGGYLTQKISICFIYSWTMIS